MRAAVFLAVLLPVASASAATQTFQTRSGHFYKDVEITKRDLTSITVNYADGIATIPLEDLPAEVQKQLGYTTNAEREQEVAKRAVQEAAEKRAAVEKAIADDKAKKEALAAIPVPTQAEANAYYHLSYADIVAKFGDPIRTREGGNKEDGNFKMYLYEDAGKKSTFFTLWEREGFVCDAMSQFKGVLILDSNKHYPTAAEVAAGLKEYQKKQEERAKVRRGAIELLKQLG